MLNFGASKPRVKGGPGPPGPPPGSAPELLYILTDLKVVAIPMNTLGIFLFRN